MRLALRSLFRSPGVFLLGVFTLGAALAVNMTALAFFDATVLRPLRVPDAARVVQLWSSGPDGTEIRPGVSWPFFQRARDAREVFADVAAALPTGFTIARDGLPFSVGGVRISRSMTGALGVAPVLGRTFSEEEERAGGAAVAMISTGFWQAQFNGDPAVIGRTLELDGVPHEIVGVVPEVLGQLFAGDAVYVPRPFELPNAPREMVERGMVPYMVLARLQPGVDLSAANSALRVLAENYRGDAPTNADAARSPHVRLLREQLTGPVRPVFVVLLSLTLCSLAIACGSLANLLLMRLLTRSRELAVRLSLGERPERLKRQLALESALVTGLALVGALLLTGWALPVVNRLAAPLLPRLPAAELSLAVIGGACLIVIVVTVGLAWLSRWHVQRLDFSEALRARFGSAPGATRLRRALVAAQIGASFALLATATLLTASLRELQHTPAGIDPEGVATAFVNLPRPRYPTAESRAQFYRTALERLRTTPEISDAAVVSIAPLTRPIPPSRFAIAGRPAAAAEQPSAVMRTVSEGYFSTLRMSVLSGRPFSEQEPRLVCVITDSLARRVFPDRSPLGQTLLIGPNAETPVEIVGVVADVRANGLAREAGNEIYLSLNAGNAGSQMAFVVRTPGAPESTQSVLRAAVAELDPQQSIAVFQTLPALLAQSIWPQRIATLAAGTLATTSAVFALLGIFGLMSFWVRQRTREWGVRTALGATPVAILRQVFSAAGGVIGAGVGTGLLLSLVAMNPLRALLVGVSPHDPVLLGAAAACFGLAALLACAWPAYRAARVNPVEALRAE